jgi:long-chain fatty acid transport protein
MRRSHKIYKKIILGALAAGLSPGLVQASGFALIENSASGQGNAYAGAAAHTIDASAVYFNPAGMMRLDGDQIVFAGHYISPESSFRNNGSSNAAAVGGGPISGPDDDGGFDALVPNFYWVTAVDDNMNFGLGVNAPFGLAIKYDDDWVGRYHAVVSDLKIINVNPSLGYRVNDKLTVGGGVNMMLADVILSSAIDFAAILGQTPGSDDGFAELTGDNLSDPALGFNLGLQYELSDDSIFGVSFRSEVDIDVDGEADFRVPTSAALLVATGRFVDTGLKAGITLPASLSVSLSHNIDKITWLADITWTGWSSFEELRIKYDNDLQPDSVTTESWNDTFRYSVGLDYQYSSNIILRGGLALDESPVPSAERRTPRLPGTDRTWLSFGASYMLDDTLSVDIGYSHLLIDDAKINNELESDTSENIRAVLVGEYDASVNILSVQLNWNY